ncbi:MAG: GLUG motif-containing protein, partial [Candidatus Thermoplasmatota archaeon]|nr:GLUG motif-containing protein [Candidatus Thermoplasmatota archaeon]
PFNGTFDGRGHTISALTLDREASYQALFGKISSWSLVENVRVEDVYVDCQQFRGALVGLNDGGTILNCSSSGIIGYASSNAGGLVGRMTGGLLDNCSSTCAVSSTNGDNIGGLVGRATSASVINNSWSTGNVQGRNNIGGFIGQHTGDGSTINGCFATGDVTANDRGGGFVGQNMNGADIYESYATGDVSVASNGGAGGFVGNNLWIFGSGTGNAIIRYCYASGNVNALGGAGGFVGVNTNGPARIFDCYATGHASGGWHIGGFVGAEWDGPIERCYSTGKTTATGDTPGGFVGRAGFNAASAFVDCRWDMNTSGTAVAAGNLGKPGDDDGIYGNTTAELLIQETYVGCDFTTVWWSINTTTRPFLQMEWDTKIRTSHQVQLMQMNLSETYTVENDIVMGVTNPASMWGTSPTQGAGFMPVAYDTDPLDPNFTGANFTGSLDGRNHTISGLYINRPTLNYTGLFGYISGTVRDVGLSNVEIIGLESVGSIAGSAGNVVVTNSYATGNVDGSFTVGGLMGAVYGPASIIDDCHSAGNVRGANDLVGGLFGVCYAPVNGSHSLANVFGASVLGGLVGASYVSVNNSHATGAVTGTGNTIGGLVGGNNPGALIYNSHATGNVEGDTTVGGLVGISSGPVSDCYATGNATATGQYAGGLVGRNQNTVNNSHATGNVSGTDFVGVLVGRNDGGIVNNSQALGTAVGDSYVGGLVGYNDGGVLNNSHSTGNTTGNNMYAGGLVGYNRLGSVINSSAVGNTAGSNYVGGLAGYNFDAAINDSHAEGSVEGAQWVGGLVGYNTGTISGSNAVGNIGGTGNNIGGLMGYNEGQISHCHASGIVEANGENVGGFAGYNSGDISFSSADCLVSNDDIILGRTGGFVGYNVNGVISDSYSIGEVKGFDRLGGFVGHTSGAASSISRCYSSSRVDARTYIGGFAGVTFNSAVIVDCYSTGSVTGTSVIGGFGGEIYYDLVNCYSTGAVSGTGGNIGGFIGRDYAAGGSHTTCFWDNQTSGQTTSDGGVGKNTAEMKTQSTFTTELPPGQEWDFTNVWWMMEGITYPLLKTYFTIRVYNVDTGMHFAGIQEAIDHQRSCDGHLILVFNGTYDENIVVNKSLTILGGSSEVPTINGTGTGDTVYLGGIRLVVDDPAGIGPFEAAGAEFGPSPGDANWWISGEVVYADPPLANGPIVNNVTGKIALIDRGTISFIEKVLAAQEAGAIGVIIANDVDGDLFRMVAAYDIEINIPSIFISQSHGDLIKTALGTETVNASFFATQDISLTGFNIQNFAGGVNSAAVRISQGVN